VSDTVSEHQRLVQETGKKLENNVCKILNAVLNKKDIHAFNVSEIKRWADKNHRMNKLIEYVKVSVKNPCLQEPITTLPDTDILVMYKQEDVVSGLINWHALCIVSCKTSFHGRDTEALFWAMLAKPSKINYVMVTEDSDRYSDRPGKRKTELGTCDKANRTRRLLESFLDRVYVIKKYDVENNDIIEDVGKFYPLFEKAEASAYRGLQSKVFDDSGREPHAGYCQMIRPFDDLLYDIMRWKFEKLG